MNERNKNTLPDKATIDAAAELVKIMKSIEVIDHKDITVDELITMLALAGDFGTTNREAVITLTIGILYKNSKTHTF